VSGPSGTGFIGRRLRGNVRRGAPPRGTRTLAAILPNGRTVWLRVDPALAPAAAVNQVAHLAQHAAERGQAATLALDEAVDRLAQAAAADAERLEGTRLRRARALRRRLVAGDHALDRRIAQAAGELRSKVERQLEVERTSVRRLRRRDLWDKLTIVSALPLFAAYGQRDRPYASNNVVLLLSLLIWLVGDEIVDAVFGSEETSPYPVHDTDAWSYVAPVANLLTGWWLLGDRQHERFITGHTTIARNAFKAEPGPAAMGGGPGLKYKYSAKVNLGQVVARAHFPDLETYKRVPAVATIGAIVASADGMLANARVASHGAEVIAGELVLTVNAIADDRRGRAGGPAPPVLDSLEIAWMVDTAEAKS
jgi:hypothetical protein